MLEAGEVDLALVSVGALPGGEFEVVPGIAIGADGPVQTVVLAGEQSPAIWDEVFLDTASRTSHVLTKLVLDEMGVRPRYTLLPAVEGLARAKGTKGALVIGDRGFDVRANHVIDLGREWNRLTGLPMIFALWAARPGRVSPEDVQELSRAAHGGLGIRTELARRFAAQKGFDLIAEIAEIISAAQLGMPITVIFINNAIYGMTGGQMAPTTLPGMKTTSSPNGRDVEMSGFPMKMCELLAPLEGTTYLARRSLHNPAEIRKAKKAIKQAFENQINGYGFSMVELLSSCPTNWDVSPAKALKFIESQMVPVYPLGDFKNAKS